MQFGSPRKHALQHAWAVEPCGGVEIIETVLETEALGVREVAECGPGRRERGRAWVSRYD